MNAGDVKKAILESGIEIEDEIAASLAQKLTASKIPLSKVHFLSEANVEKLTSQILEQVALRELIAKRKAVPSAPAAAVAGEQHGQASISSVLNEMVGVASDAFSGCVNSEKSSCASPNITGMAIFEEIWRQMSSFQMSCFDSLAKPLSQ